MTTVTSGRFSRSANERQRTERFVKTSTVHQNPTTSACFKKSFNFSRQDIVIKSEESIFLLFTIFTLKKGNRLPNFRFNLP